MWPFGIFYGYLVYFTRFGAKNLATLIWNTEIIPFCDILWLIVDRVTRCFGGNKFV
jgi:hypothetical protein